MPFRLLVSCLLVCGWLVCAPAGVAAAQGTNPSSPSNPSPSQQPGPASSGKAASSATAAGRTSAAGNGSQTPFTFQTNTRVVLTDVTVTDANGNPVKGLPQSAFRILDNNKPQAIASFEEHTAAPVAAETPVADHGVYSNDYLLHLPEALNVLVIDIANLRVEDQMYLNYELTRFLNHLPAGQMMAIYLHSDGLFMVQNFTSDRALLLAGVHRAIPRFMPFGREYLTDEQTLFQIAANLHNLPGRKNVLWFSGGSTAYLRQDATPFENQAALRAIYDELEADRIAIYPVDARGLTIAAGPAMFAQHADMADVAQATGGRAYYDTNGLDLAAAQVTDTDSSFYTVTYSPNNFRYDNKFHKVVIKVDGGANGRPFNLSYRRGYYADGSIAQARPASEEKTRTRLMAGGEKMQEKTETAPIVFQAMVLPASDPALKKMSPPTGTVTTEAAAKGSIPYSVRYSVPLTALTAMNADDRRKYTFGLAAIALDHDGNPVKRELKLVTISFNEEGLEAHGREPLDIDEALNLKKEDEFLVLAVWDTTSKRIGILQVPLKEKK